MSAEHDAGRFQPENGDHISIAGNFNEWNADPGSLDLQDPEGDWVYTIPLSKIRASEPDSTPPDTLEFKFVIRTANNRYVPNNGWETLPNRKIALSDLEVKTPEFVYNRPWKQWPDHQVTFTVDMRNQEVLGFFQPDKGDQVVVSGSFTGWSPGGIPLIDKSGDGVYRTTVPVSADPNQPVSYKFRMVPANHKILPDHGWESKANRQIGHLRSDTVLTYTAFNNLRRVARFIIKADVWTKSGIFHPLKGDILQIKIRFDGHTHLSNPLIKVHSGSWETAMAIPLNSQETEWQVVENMNKSLTQWESASVGLNGTLIRYPAKESAVAVNRLKNSGR